MIFCSNCGNPVNPDANFCECCGAKVAGLTQANPEDATSCFLPEGTADPAPEASPFAQAAAAAGPSPFAVAAAANANEPSPFAAAAAAAAAVPAMPDFSFAGADDGSFLAKADSLFADPADFPGDATAASSFAGVSSNPNPTGNAPGSANSPIWLTAKPEEPKQPKQPFFATGPNAAYHAPEESIPMPAAPVPNVPIWLSQSSDLPEDLGDLTLDDIDPKSTSPIDEVSWRAKRSGPNPPKKGLS